MQNVNEISKIVEVTKKAWDKPRLLIGFKLVKDVLTKEEGGRHTPFFSNYRPQFYFHTTDVTGVIELPEGVEMVMPGDNVTFTVELIAPVAIEKGLKFTVREGGRTVGAGVVSDILD